MTFRWNRFLICALGFCAVSPASALDGSVPGIRGDISRALLGDGTGAVIGIIDSGVDDTHPALAGLDSLGNPRMVAEANWVTYEATNTGDDVFGHGTWVASAAISRDPLYTGMAPDARYVNARVLDNGNSFPGDFQVREGIGYAVRQGSNILNLSLNFFSPNSSGNSQLDLMLDWVTFNQRVHCALCAGNIGSGDGSTMVRGPGSSYNGITVGRTTADFSRVNNDSATAFTSDGRMKPEVVAPGTALTLANDDWEGAAPDWDMGLGGCSFATPHVAGLIAQQLEAGASRGFSTDPLVVKATILNSASKTVLDKQGNPWEPASQQINGPLTTVFRPLDTHSGTGQIDGLALSNQYLAGEKAPGLVAPVGWDFNTINDDEIIDYIINPNLVVGSKLTATLTWYRHVNRFDDGNGILDANDSFSAAGALSNLNLQILRNGFLIAESASGRDSVEHLWITVDQAAQYTLRVLGPTVNFANEEFALAWSAFAVPEPAAVLLALLAAAGVAFTRRR